MDQNAWTMLLVGIALSCGLFALGVVLYPKLKAEKQGYLFEAEIEAALLPIIFQGICSAYRLSEKSVDDIHQRIRGVDKKKIADSIYGMLPDKVGVFEVVLVKRIVSRERFEQLVQDAFNRSDRFFVEHQAHFDDLFERWKVENMVT
jgi:hypothetical protein